mmetsp:Transcript_41071/g.116275  ORF Transcript_41071/g.116275 Transcript_41071/m.116275 type:complete len:270 (+) Transcript_41071:396-1205(+)
MTKIAGPDVHFCSVLALSEVPSSQPTSSKIRQGSARRNCWVETVKRCLTCAGTSGAKQYFTCPPVHDLPAPTNWPAEAFARPWRSRACSASTGIMSPSTAPSVTSSPRTPVAAATSEAVTSSPLANAVSADWCSRAQTSMSSMAAAQRSLSTSASRVREPPTSAESASWAASARSGSPQPPTAIAALHKPMSVLVALCPTSMTSASRYVTLNPSIVFLPVTLTLVVWLLRRFVAAPWAPVEPPLFTWIMHEPASASASGSVHEPASFSA